MREPSYAKKIVNPKGHPGKATFLKDAEEKGRRNRENESRYWAKDRLPARHNFAIDETCGAPLPSLNYFSVQTAHFRASILTLLWGILL